MKTNEKLNLTMLCDFYELTMGNGYIVDGKADQLCYFDVFFRNVPDGGGFAIAAGLEQVVEYIRDLHFSEDDLAYLRGRGIFDEGFLHYLENFHFTGDIYAVPEGTPVFPREPILTVRAPAIEAQLVETYILLALNHQSLIATKANRVVRAAEGRRVLEFGSRRAQGAQAAILGARAAYIGGCDGTACTISDQLYGVFAGNEFLRPLGFRKCCIRLDSGDLTVVTMKARKMLDEAGWPECEISVSNSLDEYLIQDLLRQGAQIDMFGVGERLITAKSEPVFGGVYKLVAVERPDGTIEPKIKISENVGKITNPHFKKLYRFYGADTGKAIADYLCLHDETVNDGEDLEIFDPEATWKRKKVYNFTARELQVPVFRNGELVYQLPTLNEIRSYCREQVDTLWDEVKRFDNPHTYYVDLSQKLWEIKYRLLKDNACGEHHA